jgi:hypothetical protein
MCHAHTVGFMPQPQNDSDAVGELKGEPSVPDSVRDRGETATGRLTEEAALF